MSPAASTTREVARGESKLRGWLWDSFSAYALGWGKGVLGVGGWG